MKMEAGTKVRLTKMADLMEEEYYSYLQDISMRVISRLASLMD